MADETPNPTTTVTQEIKAVGVACKMRTHIVDQPDGAKFEVMDIIVPMNSIVAVLRAAGIPPNTIGRPTAVAIQCVEQITYGKVEPADPTPIVPTEPGKGVILEEPKGDTNAASTKQGVRDVSPQGGGEECLHPDGGDPPGAEG